MSVRKASQKEGGRVASRSRLAERSDETRRALIDAARLQFAARGYSGVSTEEIVRAARVTRGALYHHFTGKDDLFRAVYEDVERAVVEQVTRDASSARDPVEALRIGARAFLDACEDPAVQRIALLDAPAVLRWESWREIGERYGFGVIQAALEAAMDADLIERQPVRPLAHLLMGSIHEAALVVARARDGGETKREFAAAIDSQIDCLAARPGSRGSRDR
jgi:AcrR family transcriptional regulator